VNASLGAKLDAVTFQQFSGTINSQLTTLENSSKQLTTTLGGVQNSVIDIRRRIGGT
jgi:hypothetical protein